MEYLLVIIVLIGSVIGLYFFIKKQIEINSKESKKEFESKLDTFVEAFKLESAKNLADQIKDSKQDQKNMSDTLEKVTKELEKIVLAKELNHGGNKVLRWMCSNLAMKTDPAGNIKMDKSKSSEKIDGMVALVMALG